jgi:hypothetical protein
MKNTQVARLLAYVTGMVNQQLLLQKEYLIAENRILVWFLLNLDVVDKLRFALLPSVPMRACLFGPMLAEVVSAVVGTSEVVHDEAARRFSTAFYRTLGNGYPVKDAFRDGGDAVAIHQLKDVFVAHGDLDKVILQPEIRIASPYWAGG